MLKSAKLFSLILIIPFVFSMCTNSNKKERSNDDSLRLKTEDGIINKSGIKIVPQFPVSQNSTTIDSIKDNYFSIDDIVNQGHISFSVIDYEHETVHISFPVTDINDEIIVFSGDYENKFIVDIEQTESNSNSFNATAYIKLEINSFSEKESVEIRFFNTTSIDTNMISITKLIIDNSEIDNEDLTSIQLNSLRTENSPLHFNSYFAEKAAIFINSIIQSEESMIIQFFDIDNEIDVDEVFYKKADGVLMIKINCSDNKKSEKKASELKLYEINISESVFDGAHRLKVEKKKSNERKTKTIKIDPRKEKME